MSLIKRFFVPNGTVLEVGCGPGRYSIAMLEQGYRVTMFDLSDDLLNIARRELSLRGLSPAGIHQGTGTDLSRFADNSFDSVLVAGPLYHLSNEEDRKKVIKEASRVLKSGGQALFAWINAWSLPKAQLEHDWESIGDDKELADYLSMKSFGCSFEENDGNPFWFSTPPDALDEIENGGLCVMTYAGAEGAASSFRGGLMELYKKNYNYYMRYVEKNVETIEHPAFRDSAEHIVVVVARKE